MSAIASWRTALRVARREARRAKGRSALVIVMIALPVLALSFAAVTYDMVTLTGAERADRTMGAADARIRWPGRDPVEQDVYGEYGATRMPEGLVIAGPGPGNQSPPTEADLIKQLPAGSTLLPVHRGVVDVRTATGIGTPNAVSIDAASPLAAGLVTVLRGRAPRSGTEVALTEPAAKRIGQGLDGTVTSADGKQQYHVVGIVEFPSSLNEFVVFAPLTGQLPEGLRHDQSWLVDTPAPVDWNQVRQLNQLGMVIASREVFIHPPPDPAIGMSDGTVIRSERELAVGVIIFGLGLLEVVLLAGPAFAVSARRRQRQLALVAANGGTPAQVRRIVLADGIVLGLAGAVAGIAAGIVAAFAARPLLEEFLVNARMGGYRVFPVALAIIAGLAVLTGLLAALVPAFITARQNVVAALAGRRGVTRSKKRWVFVGIALVAVGVGLVALGTFATESPVMLAGLVLGELGLVLCTPALVGLVARVGRTLPLAPRIALRDAARNRASAAPAISAVMAAVAGSVAIGLYLGSQRAQDLSYWQASMPAGYAQVWVPDGSDPEVPAADRTRIEAIIRANLPVTDLKPVQAVGCPSPADAGSADESPSVRELRWCTLEPELAPQYVCPYAAKVQQAQEPLRGAEARAANADQRCRRFDNSFSAHIDDGTALPILAGVDNEDVRAAARFLAQGGVVVRDQRLYDNGKVTLAVIIADGKTQGDPRASAKRVTLPAY
ncbi:MAG TPA: FtsX-like permease family protein, partial [Micromonosporaceae bacterium]